LVRQESTYYPDFSIKSFTEYVNDKVTLCEVYSEPDDDNNIHSKLYKWHENGQLLGEESYVNGIIDGPAYQYYLDGQINLEIIYKNGHKYKSKHWFEDGQLSFEYHYKGGVHHGLSRIWYPNGQLWHEHYYINGVIHGLYHVWHENGQLKAEHNYNEGVKTSISKIWNEEGVLIDIFINLVL
jgi:antitoxin component YwqK of YwqJK toxin-antitoxin module